MIASACSRRSKKGLGDRFEKNFLSLPVHAVTLARLADWQGQIISQLKHRIKFVGDAFEVLNRKRNVNAASFHVLQRLRVHTVSQFTPEPRLVQFVSPNIRMPQANMLIEALTPVGDMARNKGIDTPQIGQPDVENRPIPGYPADFPKGMEGAVQVFETV